MTRITSGISQTGGKFRLVNKLLEFTPYHEFFLSMFLGAAHYELNKSRCRYECMNDAESDIINYLVQIRAHPKEFDDMKQGVYGLVSQEICNRIVNGKIEPKNDLEKAYYFYYLNKLTFGGSIWKVRKKPPYQGVAIGNTSKLTDDAKEEFKSKWNDKQISYCGLGNSTLMDGFRKRNIKKAKEEFEVKTKGYIGLVGKDMTEKNIEQMKEEFEIKTKGYAGLNQNRAIPQTTFHEKDIEDIKASFRGVPPAGFQSKVDQAKESFKSVKEAKANYGGLIDCGSVGGSAYGKMPRKRDMHIYKESYNKAKASYKGTNPKTTRPFTNNDCGLLSPINPESIKRLRYVNLTAYDFRRVYKMFYEAFHVRKGLNRECFIYADPPFPGTEKYYGDLFKPEEHKDLIEILLETPFNFMLSIGGECEELYIEPLKEKSWDINPVKVKYSTSANTQKDSQEYICCNYEIGKIPKMIMDSYQQLII